MIRPFPYRFEETLGRPQPPVVAPLAPGVVRAALLEQPAQPVPRHQVAGLVRDPQPVLGLDDLRIPAQQLTELPGRFRVEAADGAPPPLLGGQRERQLLLVLAGQQHADGHRGGPVAGLRGLAIPALRGREVAVRLV
jgi:hypothetical protein